MAVNRALLNLRRVAAGVVRATTSQEWWAIRIFKRGRWTAIHAAPEKGRTIEYVFDHAKFHWIDGQAPPPSILALAKRAGFQPTRGGGGVAIHDFVDSREYDAPKPRPTKTKSLPKGKKRKVRASARKGAR